MKEQSDTPRTDSAFEAVDQDCKSQFEWDGWKFARQLERELATATRERDEARAIANDRDAMVDHRDRALTAMYQCVDVITQERDEARAKVERLRKVLHRLACLGNGDQYGTSFGNDIARKVLAATEAKP